MKKLLNNTFKTVKSIVGSSNNEIMQFWNLTSGLPGGKRLFSYSIGKFAPYTGTISPFVKELKPGYARVEIEDHKKIRNHLNSIHAIALANLCELTGNLALFSGMPPDGRFIVTGMEIDYEKKARGTITASSEIPEIRTNEESEYKITVEAIDDSGEVTARARIFSLVGPDE
ncbi:MAG: hotdog fold domain-containing protein [bacterium]